MRCMTIVGMLFLLVVSGIVQADMEISSYDMNGELVWSNVYQSGTYEIQWRNNLMGTGDWHTTFDLLQPGPITSGVMQVEFPLYYRISNSSNFINQAPIQTNLHLAVTNPATITTEFLLSSFAEPDGQTLFLINSTMGNNIDLLYTADNATAGIDVDVVTFLVGDGNGGVATGKLYVSFNNPPTANPITTNTLQNQPLMIDVLSANSDPDSNAFGCIAFSLPTDGDLFGADTNAVGWSRLLFMPDTNFYGTNTFGYTISDEYGASSNGVVTIIVEQLNGPPSANDILTNTAENVSLAIDVMTPNTEPNEEPFGCISFTQPDPSNGYVIVTATNQVGATELSFFPDTNFYGSNSFTYVMADTNALSQTGTIIIAVIGGVQPPEPAVDDAATPVNTPVIIYPLTNDYSPYGRTLGIIDYTQPGDGSVTNTVNSNAVGWTQLVYTPSNDYLGIDSFTYSVSDTEGLISTGEVRITVGDLFVVIDVSSGPTSTNYPVTYTNLTVSELMQDEYKTDKIVLRRIFAGSYTIGSPTSELGHVSYPPDVYSLPETQQVVTVSSDFYIGIYEVTQRQWWYVTGENPAYFDTNSVDSLSESNNWMRPIENVSWELVRNGEASPETNSFIGFLDSRTALSFELPTEEEWEYACRAGATNAYHNNLSCIGSDYNEDTNLNDIAWYWAINTDNGEINGTKVVGRKEPNSWGLYDMEGNVEEWTRTVFGNIFGIYRGGAWSSKATDSRCASRRYKEKSDYKRVRGFRFTLPVNP